MLLENVLRYTFITSPRHHRLILQKQVTLLLIKPRKQVRWHLTDEDEVTTTKV